MSTVSQHLSILRDANILIDNKQGRWVIYAIHPELENDEGIAGIIYRELKSKFEKDEAVDMDLEILTTIDRPAVTLREDLHFK